MFENFSDMRNSEVCPTEQPKLIILEHLHLLGSRIKLLFSSCCKKKKAKVARNPFLLQRSILPNLTSIASYNFYLS